MKNPLYKLERKFGKFAISNLTVYLLIGYALGYVLDIMNSDVLSYLALDPYAILHGQVWRLVTWVITPPQQLNIFILFMFLLYYSLGTSLEQYWGKFFYNLYLFSGMIFTIVGAFISYFILCATNIGQIVGEAYCGFYVGELCTTYYVLSTIFFAYTALAPNETLYLYALIPVKIKWFAILEGVIIAYDFMTASKLANYGGNGLVWAYRIIILASLLNFIIYFLATRKMYRIHPSRIKQRVQFKQSTQRAKQETVHTDAATGQHYMHKCAVCGRTELDDENLVFRYCSKCNGNYEYCEQHLYTHEHKH